MTPDTAHDTAHDITLNTVLEVKGLRASYGATPILQGVDMAIGKGEIVSLIGRNGVGKTTTMRCLIGLLRASAGGSILLQGRDITTLPSDARARLGIGYVPQGRDIFPQLTVAQNLLVALRSRKRARPALSGSTRCSRCSSRCSGGGAAICQAGNSSSWPSAAR